MRPSPVSWSSSALRRSWASWVRKPAAVSVTVVTPWKKRRPRGARVGACTKRRARTVVSSTRGAGRRRVRTLDEATRITKEGANAQFKPETTPRTGRCRTPSRAGPGTSGAGPDLSGDRARRGAQGDRLGRRLVGAGRHLDRAGPHRRE